MKITLSNIKSFIEGNFKYYLFKLVTQPQYFREQYAYRISICKDTCIKQGKCQYCGCPPVKKAFVNKSCNKGKLFPDLMNEKEWKDYKIKNNIIIDE